MLKLLATWWARRKYLWNEYAEAAKNDIQARIVESRITEMRGEAKKLVAEATAIDKAIATEEATPEYQALTGKEKYEADREKREAEKIAENKRTSAKQAEDSANQMTETMKFFRNNAAASRETAERLRRL